MLYDVHTEYSSNVPGLLAAMVVSMVPVLLVHLFARPALLQGPVGIDRK